MMIVPNDYGLQSRYICNDKLSRMDGSRKKNQEAKNQKYDKEIEFG